MQQQKTSEIIHQKQKHFHKIKKVKHSVFLKKWTLHGSSDVKKGYELILASRENTITFVLGNLMAFIVAIIAIRFFINYLKKYGFKLFGWYRIIAGIIVLALIAAGYLKWQA